MTEQTQIEISDKEREFLENNYPVWGKKAGRIVQYKKSQVAERLVYVQSNPDKNYQLEIQQDENGRKCCSNCSSLGCFRF
jgi:hypothetical protein